MVIEEKETGNSPEEESFAELFEKSCKKTARLKPGDRVEARILKVGAEWVFLDIGSKGEGVLDRKELADAEGTVTVAEGDTLPVWFVGSVRSELRFTVKMGTGAAGHAQLEDAYRAGIPVEGYVEKEIKGGFEVKIAGTVRAFCPYSQISLRRVEDAAAFVGRHLPFRITEYAERGRNIIVSHRQILEEEQRQQRDALRESLREGTTVSGTVTQLKDFGAFVDIGGIEGLIPISEVGWSRVKDIRDVLSVGQQVTVLIKKLDWEAGKFSFSLRDTLADPWESVAEKFPEGSFHTGTVARLAPFGAFVTLAAGIDGLIHISKLGQGKRINHPREVVQEGETVEVKVDGVDRENRRLSLSLAAVSRAQDEEEQTLSAFRRQGADSAATSLGSFADLLKPKHDRSKKK